MDIGDSPIFRFIFRDRDGNLADPAVVLGWVEEPPNSNVVTLNPVRVSTGIWEVTHDITVSGEHWVRVTGTGGVNAARQKKFNVTEQKAIAP